jgi:hypothetical protein
MDPRTRTKARRVGELVTTGAFLLYLVLPVGGRFLDPGADSSTLPERRQPAPLPTPKWTSSALARLPRQFDAWLSDNFGFRRHLVRWHNAVKLFGFHVSPTDELLMAREGWLFTTANRAIEAHRGTFSLTDEELGHWRRSLEARRDWLAERGIVYAFVFVPNKAAIYPEKLSPAFADGRRTPLDQLVDHMEAHSDFPFIDLRAPLLDQKASDGEDDWLYFPHGCHWTARGAHVAYTKLMNQVADELEGWREQLQPRPADEFRRVVAEGVGDGWDRRLHIPDLLVQRNVRMDRLKKGRSRPIGPERERDSTYEIAGSELPRALLLHDSFGPALRPFLREHFSRLRTINDLDLRIDWIDEERPDVVLQVIAAGRLATYVPSESLRDPERRARFDASTEVLLSLATPEQMRGIDAFRKAKMFYPDTPEDPPLRVGALPGDGFVLPSFDFPAGRSLLLRLELTSRKETVLQLLYQTESRPDYATGQAVKTALAVGPNTLYLKLPGEALTGRLLILPGKVRGRYDIHSIEVRASRPVD